MPKQKLTPWFPDDVKPEHVGWFHTDDPKTDMESDYNWWWDGKYWLSSPGGFVSRFQDRKWRGLASPCQYHRR